MTNCCVPPAAAEPPLQPLPQPSPALDAVDSRDLEDYGIDPTCPQADPNPDGGDINLVLAALLRASRASVLRTWTAC